MSMDALFLVTLNVAGVLTTAFASVVIHYQTKGNGRSGTSQDDHGLDLETNLRKALKERRCSLDILEDNQLDKPADIH